MNNVNESEKSKLFGELEHPDPNCSSTRFLRNASGTKGVECHVLDYTTEIKKVEPEVEILHPNTSENIRCFINSMPDGQKEAFTQSHDDDILRALLGY